MEWLNILNPGKSLAYLKRDDYSAASSFNRTMYCNFLYHDSEYPDFNEFIPFIKNISDKVVLDIGCGLGSLFIHHMLKFGKPRKLMHLDIDINVFYRQMLKKHHPKIAEMVYNWSDDLKIAGDVEFIPLKKNPVDIIHQYFLFGCANPSLIDKELYRILKPNGIYITSEGSCSFELFNLVKIIDGIDKYFILKPKH